MTAHYEDGPVTVWHGDCIDVMRGMPDNSVDACVTDPPYNLGFMGHKWDTYADETNRRTSKPAKFDHVGGNHNPVDSADSARTRRVEGHKFEDWCREWATEAYRLLKPGGHLLAFGGTRTFHRLAAGIEDAGFEIRDSIAWLYGSGFPKSLDVSKAIDKSRRRDFVIAAQRLGVPLPARSVDDWTKEDHAPGDKWWTEFRAHLPAEDVARIERELVGTGRSGPASVAYTRDASGSYDVTAPATADAARWNGWGTALKPAFEPIVVARKPLQGTVAANVLAYGTGALNIDGSRIGTDWTTDPNARGWQGGNSNHEGTVNFGAGGKERVSTPNAGGRWPANVVLDASQAAALDAQSGVLAAGNRPAVRNADANRTAYGDFGGQADLETSRMDAGGASRFFYTAKAGTDERPNVDGVSHPTVKPVDLMRWLVKLVTPPGGVVLEPFAGSGTTVEAAVLEGFHCIAIEREADYLPLILQRIRKPHAVGLDLDFDDAPAPAPRPTGNGRDGEASAARRYTERGGTNFAPLPGRRYNDRPQPAPVDPGIGFDFGEWEA